MPKNEHAAIYDICSGPIRRPIPCWHMDYSYTALRLNARRNTPTSLRRF